MARVTLYGGLRRLGRASGQEAPGATVRVVLNTLCATNVELARALLDGNGDLRPHVRVLVNGRDIELMRRLDTPLDESDQVAIFPPIAGGGQQYGRGMK
ncbi:MAG: MoaD/ThiS family protein [Chloroflexi bacterium]|nr:MoaD/ThiS family protein [Chloroflexota bacterium]